MKPLNAMKRMLSGSVVGALCLLSSVAHGQTVMEWMTPRGESHPLASVVIRPSDNVVIRPSDNRNETVVIRPSDNRTRTVIIRPGDNLTASLIVRPSDNRTSSVVIRPGDNHHRPPVVIRPSDNLTASVVIRPSDNRGETVVIRPSDNRHVVDRQVVIRPSDNLTDGGWLVVTTGSDGQFSAVVDPADFSSELRVDSRSSLQAEAALSLVDNGLSTDRIDLDLVADAVQDLSFSASSLTKIHGAATEAVDRFLNGSCGTSDNLADRLCAALR